MSDVETEVVKALQACPSVAGRAFPGLIDQDSPLPAVGYIASRNGIKTLSGQCAAQRLTLTITICAETFAQARTVAAEVRAGMAATETFTKRLDDEPGDEFDAEYKRYLYHLVYWIWEPG